MISDETLLQRLADIQKSINSLENNLSNPIFKEYLTIDDLCRCLKISRMTIYRYTKDGTLKPYRIAGKILYKTSEVKDSIKPITI